VRGMPPAAAPLDWEPLCSLTRNVRKDSPEVGASGLSQGLVGHPVRRGSVFDVDHGDDLLFLVHLVQNPVRAATGG
jgi:hypothetical protein